MSIIKHQHYLARKHMSWFAGHNGKLELWRLENSELHKNVNPLKVAGQKYLYEAEDLEINHVEKDVIYPIETKFFEARERIIKDKNVRRSSDRKIVKQYIVMQLLRQGHLHKRLKNMELDFKFLVKEMGLEKLWQVDKVPKTGVRKRASSMLAHGLLDIDTYVRMLNKHVVIFFERKQTDLLLPDRGIVQDYGGANGPMKLLGFRSSNLVIWLPIATDGILKILVPKRKAKFRSYQQMTDTQYEYYLQNLSLNAKSFVIGHGKTLVAAKFQKRAYFDETAERLSMVLQLYTSGTLDDLIFEFWTERCSDIPKEFIRRWFYEKKFRPALNKLFNPDNDPDALNISMKF